MKFTNHLLAMTIATMAACTPAQKQLTSGIDTANMDSTYQPGTDFYEYATAGWQRLYPLTPEYSRYGSFDQLAENNRERLRSLIEEIASVQQKEGTVEYKIATVYQTAMDSVKLNEYGLQTLTTFLACDGYQNTSEITSAWMQHIWRNALRQGIPGLFGFYIGADAKDSKNNITYIGQGGLTMPQRDYYLSEDSAMQQIRQAYVAYIQRMTSHAGFAEKDAQRISDDVMRIETRLARISRTNVQLRDVEANYNKFSYDSLRTEFSGIDWDDYFGIFGIEGLTDVVVRQPEVIHEVEAILREESPEALQNYYLWHMIDFSASYIDDESHDIAFDFYGRALSGKQEARPRWKRAVESVEEALGDAVGQIYVKKYFPAEAKARMQQLVANLQVALGDRIDQQDWMSDTTKQVAHEKLDAFYVKVGYPDEWKNYSALKVTDSYLFNILQCNEWSIQDMIKTHLNKPVDKDEWHMTPQTVNAYYNPTTNEICFPAGILQPPFFDMDADDAFNYGAIGVVIGHEMTHGFDDKGSMFDKEGNLRQWWSDTDRARFEERIHVMRAFHDSIEVLPGLHANGSFTLGENLADHGGLMVAMRALELAMEANPLGDKDGFTPQQRFFLAYSNVWAQNIREAEIRKRVQTDPHQLGKWRVNGQLPHIDAWYDAFNITPEDPMYVPKEKRVNIW